MLREWEDAEWRVKAGWVGSDLIHRPGGRGVQVLAYFWHPESLTLTGIARFGPDAESHRGLCHGTSTAAPPPHCPACLHLPTSPPTAARLPHVTHPTHRRCDDVAHGRPLRAHLLRGGRGSLVRRHCAGQW